MASPTIILTRPPATATASPTPPPTSPPPTPTAVALPVAGLAHELSLGNGTVFDLVQEREQSGRVAGWPPTPTPVPTPPSEPPARIVAASIGLDAPVVPMYWKRVARGDKVTLQWAVPRNEAGWHFSSALPGERGNTVISGHRNIYSEVFRDLDDLKVGDAIELVAGDQRYVYHVDEIHVLQELGVSASVRAQNAQWIATTDDVRLTLVTCWPYEAPGNTHRLIIVARP
ncbi:MAG TPA: sortase [Anaerolineae bacterium]|nr:sortase [Anaerolineae bacterium]